MASIYNIFVRNPKHIVITGASSGIGAALARLYAAPGVRLGLLGRDTARLDALAIETKQKGAEVHTASVAVTDHAALGKVLQTWDDASPVDLVIANAGISAGTGGGQEGLAQLQQLFDVNVTGVLNTIQPLQSRMIARQHGQLALMSSLASFRGYAGAPGYCGSKAAVRVYGEGLRAALAPSGVQVNVICPGFIATPMTAVNPYPMPFLMTAEKAAAIIRGGLAANKARIAFPFPTYAGARLLGIFPEWLVEAITGKMKKPPALGGH